MTRRQTTGLVTMAEGTHPFPSRTRPLSPPAPMVLGPAGPGRVGRCQAGEDRAFSSVGQSAPLIRVRSVVRVHQGPPIPLFAVHRLNLCWHGAIAQLGERLPRKQEVGSSNLLGSTINVFRHGLTAMVVCGSARRRRRNLEKDSGCRRGGGHGKMKVRPAGRELAP